MAGEDRQSDAAVIRILYEVEERLSKKIAALDEDVAENAAAIKKAEQDLLAAIQAIVPVTPPPEAVAAKFSLLVEGNIMGAPVTVPVTLSGGTSTFIETLADGVTVVPNIGPVVYASDNPAVATIASDGTWKPVSAGVANLSALDQGNGLTDSVSLTVTAAPPPPAVKGTFTLVPNPTRR